MSYHFLGSSPVGNTHQPGFLLGFSLSSLREAARGTELVLLFSSKGMEFLFRWAYQSTSAKFNLRARGAPRPIRSGRVMDELKLS